jgi:hypothetical protein
LSIAIIPTDIFLIAYRCVSTPIKCLLTETSNGGTKFVGKGDLGQKLAEALERPFEWLDRFDSEAEEQLEQARNEVNKSAGSDLWKSVVTPIWSLTQDFKAGFVDVLENYVSKGMGDKQLTKDEFYAMVKPDIGANSIVVDRLLHKLMHVCLELVGEQRPVQETTTIHAMLKKAEEVRRQMKEVRSDAKSKKKAANLAGFFAGYGAKPQVRRTSP